jgi:hypothetical protein
MIAESTYACIGARTTPTKVLSWMARIGERIASAGGRIASGNSTGADQAWAAGANKVDPRSVIVCLPWRRFEAHAIVEGNEIFNLEDLPEEEMHQMFTLVRNIHPAWRDLKVSAKKLLARNVAIVKGRKAVIGYVDHDKIGGGGTGIAFRLADHFKVPTFDVSDENVRTFLFDLIEKL